MLNWCCVWPLFEILNKVLLIFRMRLISNNSLPDWCDHNPDIRDGYRPPKPSFRYCLRSILALHNETGNIYTHLIGFIFYSILWWHTIQCNSFKKFASSDRFVFGTFFVGILTCFLLSTMFHTFQCHSRRVYKLFAKSVPNIILI